MSDALDFEELDTAVNDLIENVHDDQAAHDDRAKIVEAEKTETAERDQADKFSPRHFRGQFMDMVHPSSDVTNARKDNHAAEFSRKISEAKADDKANEESREMTVASENSDNNLDDKPREAAEVFAPNDEIRETDNVDEDDKASDREQPEAYHSPFLPDARAKVADQKRNLGGTPTPVADWIREFTETQPLNTPHDGADYFNQAPEFFAQQKLKQPDKNEHRETELELPADDSGKGELEPELPENDFIGGLTEIAQQGTATPAHDKDAESLSRETLGQTDLSRHDTERPPKSDTRAAIANTLIMPQHKSSEKSPVVVTKAQKPATTTHFPVWGWILIFVLLATVGAALGAWLYLSGWLS